MTESARKFWEAFQAVAESLATRLLAGNQREVFDRVEGLLGAHGFDFAFEMTHEDGYAVLVLTPEGDPERAQEIDTLLSVRPSIRKWRFYGRRQRKPLEDAFVFVRHVAGVDVSDASFDVRDTPRGYEVVMHSKGLAGLTLEETSGVVATFLDHAAGEDAVMAHVAEISGQDEGRGKHTASSLVALLVGN